MHLTSLLSVKPVLNRFYFFFAVMFVLTIFPLIEIFAQGNLVIIPRRVVFEGNVKSQDITLANGGTDTSTYLISLVQMRMKEDGSFEVITTPDPGQKFADKYIRFYPRKVTLKPKESQLIKMQVVNSGNMEPGEYRSHIYFRAVPNTKPLGSVEEVQDSAAFSATLTTVFGITIPVIIRVGDPTVKVTLTDIGINKVQDTLTVCKMTFNRTGDASSYGDLEVNYIAPDGKVTQVSLVKGIGVYTPNTLRRFDCALKNADGVDYRKGKLRIIYSHKNGSKPVTLAESELLLK